MNEIEILQEAITTYGVLSQRIMLIEEVGELLNAIGKRIRGRASDQDVIEELVDVVVMCEQSAMSISFDDYRKMRREKLARLEVTLSKH